jgi:hypothetical protein
MRMGAVWMQSVRLFFGTTIESPRLLVKSWAAYQTLIKP